MYKLALIQLKVLENKSLNLLNARKSILNAAASGAKIISLPECFNCPYGVEYFKDYAEDLSSTSSTMQMLSKTASDAKVYLIGGSIPEKQGDQYFNTCCVFNPTGELIAKHRKLHLFDIDIPSKITFKESLVLSPGDKITCFDTIYGKVGVAICYDIRFPEVAMVAARSGVHLMVYPGAFNMTTGPLHWELLTRARAVDNQIYVSVCSPARDTTASYVAYGHSCVSDPQGQIISTLDENEGILYCDIDSQLLQNVREWIPVGKQRRFDILSIQSHVVHGYVGNKAATFPLQFIGHDVDALNTVQLSNHTQYPHIKGSFFDSQHYLDLYEGLDLNHIQYDCVLTGYVGKGVGAVSEIIQKLKVKNPKILYLLDPVIGDNGKMYVPEEVIPVFKNMIKFSDIVTPNDFEIEKLTGIKVSDLESAKAAVKSLHSLGAKTVILTSFQYESELALIGSRGSEMFVIKFPRLNANFTGTGDLLAALIVAHISSHGIKETCEIAITIMQKILSSTFDKFNAVAPANSSEKMDALELDLINSRHNLICQVPEFKASILS